MFEDEPQWEMIDSSEHEGEEVEREDGDVVSALDAPATDGVDGDERSVSPELEASEDGDEETPAVMAMPSDAVSVAPVAHAAAAIGRHDKPYEREVKKATGHDAERDRYNDPDVRSNRVGNTRGNNGKLRKDPNQIGRPGLRVHGKDEFHLRGEFAYRYQIVNGTKAIACDKIWENELQHGRGDGQRLALNPSAPRRLFIDGVGVWCVMSWAGDQSAAWIAIKDLKGKFADIKGQASQMSRKWNPKDAGKAKRDHATEMKFRAVGDPIATADNRYDKHRYIVPGQKKANGNEVGDYLSKDVLRRAKKGVAGAASPESKRLEHANTAHPDQPLDIGAGERDIISIVGNLPHDKTPPVAIDVAQPGVDSFFVPKGKTFRREISLYKRKAKKSTLRQTWVFGYVGRDEGNRKVADKNRRGWVPLRVLARP